MVVAPLAVEGTKAEKRRRVLCVVFGLGCGLRSAPPLISRSGRGAEAVRSRGRSSRSLATPLYGVTFVVDLFIGIGLVLSRRSSSRRSIQDRHDGASEAPAKDRGGQPHRRAGGLRLQVAEADRPVARRRARRVRTGHRCSRSSVALSRTVEAVVPTADGKKAVLWTLGWSWFHGETIDTASGHRPAGEPLFVKMRPEDLDAGGMETVSRGASRRLRHDRRVEPSADRDRDGRAVPVTLIRIRPEDEHRVVKRQGQEKASTSAISTPSTKASAPGLPVVALRTADPTASCARATSPS